MKDAEVFRYNPWFGRTEKEKPKNPKPSAGILEKIALALRNFFMGVTKMSAFFSP